MDIPDCKILHRKPFGIMGDELRAPSLNTSLSCCVMFEEFQGGLNFSPYDAEIRHYLERLYVEEFLDEWFYIIYNSIGGGGGKGEGEDPCDHIYKY